MKIGQMNFEQMNVGQLNVGQNNVRQMIVKQTIFNRKKQEEMLTYFFGRLYSRLLVTCKFVQRKMIKRFVFCHRNAHVEKQVFEKDGLNDVFWGEIRFQHSYYKFHQHLCQEIFY